MRALLFDVDGTLAETEEIHRAAFNEAFAAFGLPWSWDRRAYRRLLDVTGGKERIRHFIEAARPPGGAETLPRIAELHAEKTLRYARLVESGAAVLRPGVGRLIAEAREAGLKVAIATTTTPANVEALILSAMGTASLDLFDVIGAGDIVPAKKPAPDIYLWVLGRLGLAPSEAVALEDSRNGLVSAQAAGLATVVAPSLYADHQRFDGALALLSDLGEPDRPYAHLAGAGAADPMVTVASLRRWLGEAG